VPLIIGQAAGLSPADIGLLIAASFGPLVFEIPSDHWHGRPLANTYKVCIMKPFEIQYHKAKNAANKLKHQGISLAETEAVFYDEKALSMQDNDHDEQRWITLGLDAKGRLLVVAYTYRDPNFVRIISARIATKNERRRYLEA
jgi:uncharacterized DUF497 family protein